VLRQEQARGARGFYALLMGIAAILAAACGVSTAANSTRTATGDGPSVASSAGGFRYTGRKAESGIPCATLPTEARLPPITYRPPSLAAGQRVPLLVALHSFGGTPADMEGLTHFEHLADEHGFVVAYLASCNLAHPWGPADDLAYVNSEIDQISAQDNIDPSRVYVTGYSAGGYETWNAGCRLSSKVAAIAVVSNAMNGVLFQTCTLTKPVSQLLMVGTADGTRWTGIPGQLPNPFQTTARWRALDGCAAQPIQTQVVSTVTQETWSSCADGSTVALYIVRGASHV
jgi:polyhydroxybutyrate depolymerase